MTFTKLFSSITESTIWVENAETRIVWITMLAMSDRKGRIWASIPGLANRARVPLASCETALEKFQQPDPYSRTHTDECEGRRIEAIDGGWRLINYDKYRAIRDEEITKEQTAVRVRRHRQKKRNVTQVTRRNDNAEAEAEAEADIDLDLSPNGDSRQKPLRVSCPVQAIIDLYHEVLPDLPRMRKVTDNRRAQIRQRWNDGNQDIDGWRKFFMYIGESEFLSGKRPPGNGSTRPFIADLPWITKAENWAKIVDGKYHRE